MGWKQISADRSPVGRPLLVRMGSRSEPIVAFLSADLIWYEGGALVQGTNTFMSDLPTEWCEPDGEASP
jgi:hypothetical protein